jgi:hypothetical protein
MLREYQLVYSKEVSRNVVNTKASTAFAQRLIVASSLLLSIRVVYNALAAAKRTAGCALHVTLDFISRTPVTADAFGSIERYGSAHNISLYAADLWRQPK